MMAFIKWGFIFVFSLLVLAGAYYYYLVVSFDTETLPKYYGKVQATFYLGDGDKQPLIVALGGSEGGNAWTSDYWKKQRETFIKQGYAFLAIGYFGMEGIPENLDRIALEGVHQAVMDAAKNPKVNQQCIAIMGGSKGGELALTLASHYPDFKAVVGIVPSHTVFAGMTLAMTTSSFALNGEPLPFVPVPWSAAPALLTGDLRTAFEKMLENKPAVNIAAIKVEDINGPVLLLSGTEDEQWPSMEMSNLVAKRLKNNGFVHHYQHIAIEGGHSAPLNHFDKIMTFLDQNFMSENPSDCERK